MIHSRWLTGKDDLSPILALRGRPADPADAQSLHALVLSDDTVLAAGRLHDTAGVFLIDELAVKSGVDPQVMTLAAQLLIMKAAQLGAQEIYADAAGPVEALLADIGFTAVEPGGLPNATMVFHVTSSCAACGGCGGCGGCDKKE